jgi:hypothetical protein
LRFVGQQLLCRRTVGHHVAGALARKLMTTTLRMFLPFAALACYIAAFVLPALYLTGQANTDGRQTSMVGVMAFINGFFALFNLQLAWLANPLAALALILLVCRVHLLSLAFSLAAVLVAQHTWVVVGSIISGDEGGVTKYLVTSLGPGFYLWSFSFLLLAVVALVGRSRETVLN